MMNKVPANKISDNQLNGFINKKYNNLIILSWFRKSHYIFFNCKCECGSLCVVEKLKLQHGQISCGCNQREIMRQKQLKHGFHGTRFYRIWRGIKNRTLNKNEPCYNLYGGRGIKISDEWLDFKKFKEDMYNSYLEHIKECGEKNTKIERIDNNGNYCKENCKWATQREQGRNTRVNRMITFKNKTLCLTQWAELFNIKPYLLRQRLFRDKWSIEKALTRSTTSGCRTSLF